MVFLSSGSKNIFSFSCDIFTPREKSPKRSPKTSTQREKIKWITAQRKNRIEKLPREKIEWKTAQRKNRMENCPEKKKRIENCPEKKLPEDRATCAIEPIAQWPDLENVQVLTVFKKLFNLSALVGKLIPILVLLHHRLVCSRLFTLSPIAFQECVSPAALHCSPFPETRRLKFKRAF